MNRGDIVIVADRAGDFSGKPHSGLIVQSDAYNATHQSVTICPISSAIVNAPLFRSALMPDDNNGLIRRCDVAVDKIQAVRRSRIGDRVGHVAGVEMAAVDAALRRWLSL